MGRTRVRRLHSPTTFNLGEGESHFEIVQLICVIATQMISDFRLLIVQLLY